MKKYLSLMVCFTGLFCFCSCSPGNLEYVKQHSEDRWKEYGMSPVAYEGFEWGFWGINSYGGAKVWYRLKKDPDNGITYTGYLQRW